VRVIGTFFPKMMREPIKDEMAELGMTEEDLRELMRKRSRLRLRQQSPNRPPHRYQDREEGHKLCILINESSKTRHDASALEKRGAWSSIFVGVTALPWWCRSGP
jgi:hypothetical protein